MASKLFRYFIVLVLCINFVSADIITSEEFINKLAMSGEISLADKPLTDLIKSQCQNYNYIEGEDHLTNMCKVAMETDICKGLEEEKRIDCENYHESLEFDSMDLLAGCIDGFFEFAMELIDFISTIVTGAVEAIGNYEDTIQNTREFAESARLYVVNEYDKAYETSSSPFRALKASKIVARTIFDRIYDSIQEALSNQYQEIGCMNFEARTTLTCKIVAEFVPPMAMLAHIFKKGAKKAISGIKKRNSVLERSDDSPNLTSDNSNNAPRSNDSDSNSTRTSENTDRPVNHDSKFVGDRQYLRLYLDGGTTASVRYLRTLESGKIVVEGIDGKAHVIDQSRFRNLRVSNDSKLEFESKMNSANARHSFYLRTGDSDYDFFRSALKRNQFIGDDRFVSYIDGDGVRRPGKVIGNRPNRITVLQENGKPLALTGEKDLYGVKRSNLAKDIFDERPPVVKLTRSGDQRVDQFRAGFNSRRISEENRYVSFRDGDERVAGRVVGMDADSVLIEDEFGRVKMVKDDELNNIRVSQESRKFFEAQDKFPPLPLSGKRDVDTFRVAYSQSNFSGDAKYISVIRDGKRIKAVVTRATADDVEIVDEFGRRSKLGKQDLITSRFSENSKDFFSDYAEQMKLDNNFLQVSGTFPRDVVREGPPLDLLERNKGEPIGFTKFKSSFNRGQILNEDRFVEVYVDGQRQVAEVTKLNNDSVIVNMVDGDNLLREVKISGDELYMINTSERAKTIFEKRGHTLRISSDTEIQGVKLNDLIDPKMNGNYRIDVDLSSPGLRKWVANSQRLIESKLGIKPGMNQRLTRSQQEALFNVYLRSIVPRIESKTANRFGTRDYGNWENSKSYGKARSDVVKEGGGRQDLGRIIEESKAVCSELSMFGSILLSQYGIRSRVALGSLYKRGEYDKSGKQLHGRHGWIELLDKNGNMTGVLDSNNSKRFHPDFQDYDETMKGIDVEHRVELINTTSNHDFSSLLDQTISE